jgi:hypothetical protein
MAVLDRQLRFLLLTHIASRIVVGASLPGDWPGLSREDIRRLGELSAQELLWLAATRDLRIDVEVDAQALLRALKIMPLIEEAEWLKSYFLDHGASWQIMRDLFKIRRKLVHRRRREVGAWCPPGRLRLPDDATREQIWLAWETIEETDLRLRYYRLHQRFPDLLIRVLEEVLRDAQVRP